MPVPSSRGVPVVSFTGTNALEVLSDYSQPVLLRLVEGTTDVGAVDLSPYDPGFAPNLTADGFTAELFDHPGGTLLATGSAHMRGQRAYTREGSVDGIECDSQPPNNTTFKLTYPLMSDEAAAFATKTITYTWRTVALGATVDVANELLAIASESIGIHLDRLVNAINGTAGYGSVDQGPGTESCPEVVASRAGGVLMIEARQGGTWGDRIRIEIDAGLVTAPLDLFMSRSAGLPGIKVDFASAELPASLVPDGVISRKGHIEVFGHAENAAVKVKTLTGPALLHASS